MEKITVLAGSNTNKENIYNYSLLADTNTKHE